LFVAAKDDGGGGDNWSCKTCKAPIKSSPSTNQHPVFYRPDALPVGALKGNITTTTTLIILAYCLAGMFPSKNTAGEARHHRFPGRTFGVAGARFLTGSVSCPWGTDIRGLMRGMATLPQGNQELLMVRDKVGRPQVSLE